MPLHATAHRVPGTLRNDIVIDRGRHVIYTDEPRTVEGGSDTGPSPHELLPASLASCIATTIAMYAARKGWDVGELSVDVKYHQKLKRPRFDIDVHLPDDLEPEQLDRLMAIAGRCPVQRALQAGFDFTHELAPTPRTRAWAAA